MPVTHEYVSATPDDPSDEISSSEWNADHVGTNEHTHADTNSGGTDLEPLTTHALAVDAHHSNSDPGPDADVTVDTTGGTGLSDSFARSQHGHRLDTSTIMEPVGDTQDPGIEGTVQRAAHMHEGLHSVSKSGSTQLIGDVEFAEGSGIDITQVGQVITIAGTGGGALPAGQISIRAAGLTPSVTDGADPAVLVEKGNISVWQMPFPADADRFAEMDFDMPDDWDGGDLTAELKWGADDTAATVIVTDSFTRSTADSWGTAPTGGAYTTTTGGTAVDVNGSQGTMDFTSAGQTRRVDLTSVVFDEGNVVYSCSVNQAAVTSYHETCFIFRKQVADTEYRMILRRNTDNTVELRLVRRIAATNLLLTSAVISGITNTGQQISIRCEILSASPTIIRARAWATSGSEPSSWNIDTTDSGAGLQVAGYVGLYGYVNTGATISPSPLVISYDNFTITEPGGTVAAKWQIDALCMAEGDDMTTVDWGTPTTVVENADGDNLVVSPGDDPFVADGNPAGGNQLHIRIGRLGSDAADTLGNDAHLFGVRIGFTRV